MFGVVTTHHREHTHTYTHIHIHIYIYLLYFCKLLYMFRVVTPPIIRSTHTHIYIYLFIIFL